MAVLGDLVGFNAALDAFPALSLKKLVIIHPHTVGIYATYFLDGLLCIYTCMYVCGYVSRANLYSMYSASKVGSIQRLQC